MNTTLLSRKGDYWEVHIVVKNSSQLWIDDYRYVEHDEGRWAFIIDFRGPRPVRYEFRKYLVNWKGTPLIATANRTRAPKVQYDEEGKPYYIEYICENEVTS